MVIINILVSNLLNLYLFKKTKNLINTSCLDMFLLAVGSIFTSVFFLLLVENIFRPSDNYIIGTFIEEFTKIIFLFFLYRKKINVFDCLIFGLCFGIIENTIIASSASFYSMLIRVASSLLHPSTVIIFFIIKRRFNYSKTLSIILIIVPVIIHIIYNVLVRLATFYIVYLLLIIFVSDKILADEVKSNKAGFFISID